MFTNCTQFLFVFQFKEPGLSRKKKLIRAVEHSERSVRQGSPRPSSKRHMEAVHPSNGFHQKSMWRSTEGADPRAPHLRDLMMGFPLTRRTSAYLSILDIIHISNWTKAANSDGLLHRCEAGLAKKTFRAGT